MYEPETPIKAVLSGNISPIQWDEVSSAYYYIYEDGESHEVWLAHPATIAYRMETAVKHNLQGIAFTTPSQLPDPGQTVDPTIVWTVLDDMERQCARRPRRKLRQIPFPITRGYRSGNHRS